MHIGEIYDLIKKKATEGDKPELEKVEGMVHHLWGDGELTCQKSGSLLWQRSLHQFKEPVLPASFAFKFPRGSSLDSTDNSKTFIATNDKALIQELRVLMAEWMLAYVKHIPVS